MADIASYCSCKALRASALQGYADTALPATAGGWVASR